MLEFNQEHKFADLTEIKKKTEMVKKTGKVVLAGITLSAVLLLSGCESENKQEEQVDVQNISSTAIIMENGNALLVDLESYMKYSEDIGATRYRTLAEDRTWVLYTSLGDKLLVDYDSVKFIEGEDAHQKAEIMAQSLISENGQISCYDDVLSHSETR